MRWWGQFKVKGSSNRKNDRFFGIRSQNYPVRPSLGLSTSSFNFKVKLRRWVDSRSRGSQIKKITRFLESGTKFTLEDLVWAYLIQVFISRSNYVGGVNSRSRGARIKKIIDFLESGAKITL